MLLSRKQCHNRRINSYFLVICGLLIIIVLKYINECNTENRFYLVENQTNQSTKQRKLKHRFPKAIIIGVRKCGTFALLNALTLHSKIETTARKHTRRGAGEVNFFSSNTIYKKGLEWYRNCMPLSAEDQITIEKSPTYFLDPLTPKRIREFNRDIKLIVILRDPVTRLISDYTHVTSNSFLL